MLQSLFFQFMPPRHDAATKAGIPLALRIAEVQSSGRQVQRGLFRSPAAGIREM